MQAPQILDYLGCKSGSDGMHFPLEAQLVYLLLVCQCGFTVSLYSLCILGLHLSL